MTRNRMRRRIRPSTFLALCQAAYLRRGTGMLSPHILGSTVLSHVISCESDSSISKSDRSRIPLLCPWYRWQMGHKCRRRCDALRKLIYNKIASVKVNSACLVFSDCKRRRYVTFKCTFKPMKIGSGIRQRRYFCKRSIALYVIANTSLRDE